MPADDPRRFMIIAITSLNGGVGKTITAIHLATYFQTQAPTALVGDEVLGDAVDWTRRYASGLRFTVCSRSEMNRLRPSLQHIVIDGKHSPDTEQLQDFAKTADLIVVPCTPDVISLATLRRLDRLLEGFGSPNYRILLTNVPAQPQKDGDEARRMLELFDFPIFRTEIQTSKAFEQAILQGCTVRELSGNTRHYRAWSQYEALGREIETLPLGTGHGIYDAG
jgi:chromosome partitioning protein